MIKKVAVIGTGVIGMVAAPIIPQAKTTVLPKTRPMISVDTMEETLTNRRKIIEEDIQEAEELKDKALVVEKTLNNELEEARVKANDILRNCKDEIKRNTQDAIADIDVKIAELIKVSEKNFVSTPFSTTMRLPQ